MAETNFKIFNEENSPDRTYNDSEYEQATQRQSGVIPGMALSRLHNKLYLQATSMCKAIADFIVSKGHNCMDNDVHGITANLEESIKGLTKNGIDNHNTDANAHENGIAGNAATATKATQDSAGQQINTTYIKGITASNATITTTKGNGSTSSFTVNNVSHSTSADSATKATQDSSGRNIVNTYAPKASPAFSGAPTAPTPATTDNSTKIATTAFINNLINYLKNNNSLIGIKAKGKTSTGGYLVLTDGTIINYGTGTTPASGTYTIYFPLSYAKGTIPYVSFASYVVASQFHNYSNIANDGMTIQSYNSNTGELKGNLRFSYIAIG